MSVYAERRAHVLETMGRGVAILASTPVALRNNDVEHAFRQDSDLYYLTGLDEPESVLILTTEHAEHRTVLFVRPRDPARETWDGPRTGVDGAVRDFGADVAFPIGELAQRLPDYVANARKLFYRVARDRTFDARVLDALELVRSRHRLGVTAPSEIIDVSRIVHEMRLRKTEAELELMARAAAVTREAHERAMHVGRPGRYEYEVEAEILRVFRSRGAERPAYLPIVGSGPNATILHHRRNDRLMEDGDLVLIDAGAEVGYYASDVTRTFPVSGRFTEPQRAIYDVVLDAQSAAIDAVRPGALLEDVHAAALRVITAGLVRLGILAGELEQLLKDAAYKPFYMHRTSHWLGMDVHDVGAYHFDGVSRPLEPGMVLTVEPGLYVATDAGVDARWRGIGVRIEDDVLVTGDGRRLLTDAPKAPDELERLLGSRV